MQNKKKKKKGMAASAVRMKCKHCDKILDQKSMRRHVRTAHENFKFRCEQGDCTMEYNQKSSLLNHLYKVHQVGSPPSTEPVQRNYSESLKDVSKIECEKCSRLCPTMAFYRQHMQEKHSLKCKHCDYTTIHSKKLRFHVKKR